MSVHYKFKSNLDHDTVTFDGLSISVADLKKSIMQQKKIGKSSDFDLQITNAQTKEVYDNDELLIPKNTSVIVARVPVAAGSKKNWDKPDLPLPIDDDDLGQIRYDRIVKNADLINANTTEEDKVKAMITQSSVEYDPSKYVKSRSMTGPLPPTYTCFRCGTQGHWIKNCPTNNPDVKRSTGIPRSFMVPVDGPEHKGALLTSSGDYAVPLIDHQAYKEVKKEKPPFLPQEEPIVEPEAQIPEELLCRVCKDLLQDAVLIHCCGNSFCDECIRQVLLESDNHECPECQEVDVSPDTLIPNRYLRRAVLNFKNQTGYTRAKKASYIKSPPPERVPSPDSTVESQPPPQTERNTPEPVEEPPVVVKQEIKQEIEDPPPPVSEEVKDDMPVETGESSQQPATPPRPGLDEDSQDIQPGTPLADEPPVDEVHHETLPIQAIGQEQYHSDRYDYHSGSKYPPNYRDDYRNDRYEDAVSSSEPKPISTIATITNTRKCRMGNRPAPVRQQFPPNQRPPRDDRPPDSYGRERDDYHRYDRRHERGAPRTRDHSRYNRSPQRYHANDYHHSEEHHESHYEMEYETRHTRNEETHRHVERYRVPPHPVPVPTPVPVYSVPPTVPVPAIIPAAPVYPPQPPPPGASPIDTLAAQPPPPGVGPLLPLPNVPGEQPPFNNNKLYEAEEPQKESKKVDDRSIDDKMEAFQRELEKREREYSRDRASRSRSRSSGRERSRSSSRSRSYSSSKSWTRSSSRSSTRSSWTRSRTPLSSRSRTRSYTHSRSRSWSKARSYTRSRSRTRTESSRSRSRSRTEPRFRRRFDSRERIRSPRPRSRSRSFTPKNYRPPHRNVNDTGRHSYTPPHYGTSYQYGPPPAANVPVLRPDYSSHHIHPVHPVPPPLHSRPVDHYPIDRPPKGPPSYPEVYPPAYNVYQQQRYEREPRVHERDPRVHERDPRIHERDPRVHERDPKVHERDPRVHERDPRVHERDPRVHEREQRVPRYDKRQDYEKRQDYQKDYSRQHPEVIARRIPGYVGNRTRDYEQRYRQPRGLQKEMIRELPQIPEQEIRVVQTKEIPEEPLPKKREEKVPIKHKKHHHHHKNKESKKQESKIPVVVSVDKQQPEATRNLVKVEVQSDKSVEINPDTETSSKAVKNTEKVKDKKHKHKKHKNAEQATKKKKATKKEKVDASQGAEPEVHTKVKVKKKKVKQKPAEDVSNEPIETEENSVPEAVTKPEEAAVDEEKPEETNAVKDTSADTLDIFAEEGENALLSSDPVPDADPNEMEVAEGEGEEEENADENAEMSDEAVEENIEESLHVDVPEMSKWEREELEDDMETRPQRKSAVVVPKEEKEALTSDIIQRAELAILSKPLKPQVALKDKGDSKASSVASSPENTVSQVKEPELKSVIKSERLSPALQVTISTTKEKRSVHSKKDQKSSKDSSQVQSKRIKLDRSNYAKSDELPHRTVSTSKTADRIKDSRDRTNDRYDRKRSPVGGSSRRTLSSDRRERDYSNRRVEKEREVRYNDDRLRDERRHRFADDRYVHTTREPIRQDRRRPLPESASYSRSSRYYGAGRENTQGVERSRKTNFQRSRSRSLESAESFHSYKKKEHLRHVEQSEASHHRKSSRDHYQSDASDTKHKRKHSPIKPPEKHSESERVSKKPPRRDYHDDLKFEPDYDAFSENEEKESRERIKRSATPEVARKKARTDKIEKESQKIEKSSSSEDSSAVSESESSDSDDPKSSKKNISDSDHKQKHKKSKHKKHKKHKHKHKKKKSHKSKKE